MSQCTAEGCYRYKFCQTEGEYLKQVLSIYVNTMIFIGSNMRTCHTHQQKLQFSSTLENKAAEVSKHEFRYHH